MSDTTFKSKLYHDHDVSHHLHCTLTDITDEGPVGQPLCVHEQILP